MAADEATAPPVVFDRAAVPPGLADEAAAYSSRNGGGTGGRFPPPFKAWSPTRAYLQSVSPQSPLQSPLRFGIPQRLLQSGRPQSPLQSLLQSGSPQSPVQSPLRSWSPQSPLQSLLQSGSPQNHSWILLRSCQVVVICSTLVASYSAGTALASSPACPVLASCSACPALAPLSAYSTRPSSIPRAWPTVPTPDLTPAHPPPRNCSVLVCEASGIHSLRGGGGGLSLYVEQMACC